jgi:hypothetical protein
VKGLERHNHRMQVKHSCMEETKQDGHDSIYAAQAGALRSLHQNTDPPPSPPIPNEPEN